MDTPIKREGTLFHNYSGFTIINIAGDVENLRGLDSVLFGRVFLRNSISSCSNYTCSNESGSFSQSSRRFSGYLSSIGVKFRWLHGMHQLFLCPFIFPHPLQKLANGIWTSFVLDKVGMKEVGRGRTNNRSKTKRQSQSTLPFETP